MIKVYYLTRDCGDGSSTVDFFLDGELAERLTLEHEDYMMNDYIPSFEVPDIGTLRFSDKYYAEN